MESTCTEKVALVLRNKKEYVKLAKLVNTYPPDIVERVICELMDRRSPNEVAREYGVKPYHITGLAIILARLRKAEKIKMVLKELGDLMNERHREILAQVASILEKGGAIPKTLPAWVRATVPYVVSTPLRIIRRIAEDTLAGVPAKQMVGKYGVGYEATKRLRALFSRKGSVCAEATRKLVEEDILDRTKMSCFWRCRDRERMMVILGEYVAGGNPDPVCLAYYTHTHPRLMRVVEALREKCVISGHQRVRLVCQLPGVKVFKHGIRSRAIFGQLPMVAYVDNDRCRPVVINFFVNEILRRLRTRNPAKVRRGVGRFLKSGGMNEALVKRIMDDLLKRIEGEHDRATQAA